MLGDRTPLETSSHYSHVFNGHMIRHVFGGTYTDSWAVDMTETKQAFGEKVEGWYTLKKLGRLPQTPYRAVHFNALSNVEYGLSAYILKGMSPTTLGMTMDFHPANLPCDGFVPPDSSPADLISSRNLALAKFNKHMRDKTFDAIPFVGALPESIAMMRDAHKLLGSRASAVFLQLLKLAGNPSKARAAASDAWLAFHFGAMPLYQDITSAIDALLRHEEDEPFRETTSGSGRIGIGGGFSKELGIPYTGISSYNLSGSWHSEVSTRFGVTWQQDFLNSEAHRATLQKTWGMTPWDILPGAWELIPYSWLVDYFTNVGDIINWYSIPMPPWISGFESRRFKKTLDFSHVVSPGSDGSWKCEDRWTLSGRVTWTTYERVPLADATFRPTFRLSFPSTKQAKNLLALVSSRTHRTPYALVPPGTRALK